MFTPFSFKTKLKSIIRGNWEILTDEIRREINKLKRQINNMKKEYINYEIIVVNQIEHESNQNFSKNRYKNRHTEKIFNQNYNEK